MNKLFKAVKNRKGFTLVEIIVVLVIIAVMAAVAIPNMLGFVQEARGSGYMAEARVGLVAAQSVVTRLVANGTALETGTALDTQINTDPTFIRMVADLTGSGSGANPPASDFTGFVVVNNSVTELQYVAVVGTTTYTVTINNGDTTVAIS